jgi:hypothetical protein
MLVLAFLLIGGCQVESPPSGPEATCAKACAVQAPGCTSRECARGCNLVLDRLAEHEGAHVLACVASAHGRCDDRTWAACAARIGPHADGGPPAPPPPAEDDGDEEPP